MKLHEVVNPNAKLKNIDDIKKWLDSYNIKNYTIDPKTLIVDVDNNVDIKNYKFQQLPVQFGRVNGYFTISHSKLKTLNGCPHFVGDSFDCTSSNNLRSAIGGPKIVTQSAFYGDCPLKSTQGLPEEVHGTLWLYNTNITSLAELHKQVKLIAGTLFIGNAAKRISGGLVGLLLIHKLVNINITVTKSPADIKLNPTSSVSFRVAPIEQAGKIINKHLASDRSTSACIIELMDAGLEEFAEL